MLSICIPTMRRWKFLKETIPTILSYDCVGEVVICDETGEDAEEISKSVFGSDPKLKVHVNKERLGIYENKVKVASLASLDWIGLLDSDNIFPETWFEIISETIPTVDSNTILASASFKNINLDNGQLSFPCKEFSDLKLNKSNWNSIFQRSRWNFLLNDGNWVFHKSAVSCFPLTIKSNQLEAADAIFMLKEMIKNGYTIWYVPKLEYIHTVHNESSWLQTAAKSSQIFGTINWKI
jgi:glycosyltransferase involved in cell wall biosynthesis